jgi:hypothetical protein
MSIIPKKETLDDLFYDVMIDQPITISDLIEFSKNLNLSTDFVINNKIVERIRNQQEVDQAKQEVIMTEQGEIFRGSATRIILECMNGPTTTTRIIQALMNKGYASGTAKNYASIYTRRLIQENKIRKINQGLFEKI